MDYTLTIYFEGKYREVKGRIYQNAKGVFVFSSNDGWIEEQTLDLIKDSFDGYQILKLRELGWRP